MKRYEVMFKATYTVSAEDEDHAIEKFREADLGDTDPYPRDIEEVNELDN